MAHGSYRPTDYQRYRDAVRTYAGWVGDRFGNRPVGVTALLASLLLFIASYRVFSSLGPTEWPFMADSIIFEYVGWYVTQGNRLYVDVWAVKPPLAFEVPAVLALVAGGSVVGYHVLNLLVTGGALVVGTAMAAGIVHELTDDFTGAVVAGLATFTLPFYFYRALVGFKAKYFVVAAGLACLYLAYRERPVLAGIAGAAAVGFWQLAVVFPLVGLGRTWQTSGRPAVKRFLLASAGTGAIVLLPVVAWGALPAMIAETVLAPLLVPESVDYANRIQTVLGHLGTTLPVALIGLAGLVAALAPDRLQDEWPLVLVVGWFSLVILTVDYDYIPDLFPWFAMVAMGVGLVIGHARGPAGDDGGTGSSPIVDRPAGHRALALAILAMAVLSVATLGGFGTGETDLPDHATYDLDTSLDVRQSSGVDATSEADPGSGVAAGSGGPRPSRAGAAAGGDDGNTGDDAVQAPYQPIGAQYVYWNRVEIRTCRAFGGHTQSQLVDRLGLAEDRPWYDVPCGRFDPAWQAVWNGTTS